MSTQHYQYVHTGDNDPRFNMPYTPGIQVTKGSVVYLSGVTAAPIYHSHPHVKEEFDAIPEDPARQAEACIANLLAVVKAAGGDLDSIVEATRYIVDLEANQDAINRVLGNYFGSHRPATTTVEVVRLATDPRLVLELKAVAVV